MKNHINQYRRQTTQSMLLYRQARQHIPGGLSHGLRFFEPYPLYIRRGEGSRIWDADGREYIDLWMAQFCLVLGHRPEPVTRALREALDLGIHWGSVHEHEIELARLVCEMVPCAQRVRFCASGTEAAMYAVRLARGFTSRRIIIKMEGGWHGAGSDLCGAVHPPYNEPECAGILREASAFVRAVPFNDTEAVVAAIRESGDDLAGVILEPVMGLGGFIPASQEFLETVRDETDRLGALLIFDEVVTGFWLAPGGAQEVYGIIPDLTVLGKPLGGGANIGAVAGREAVLALSDPTIQRPRGEGVTIGGGTFSATPLSMVAGAVTLKYLKDQKEQVYPRIHRLGQRLRRGMEASAARAGLLLKTNGLGPLSCAYLPNDPDFQVRSAGDMWLRTDIERLLGELRLRLINHGVYSIVPGGAICAAHTEEEVDHIIEAVGLAAQEMMET